MLFSNENNFGMGPASCQFMRRPKYSSPLNPRYIIKTKKLLSVTMWGCFSYQRREALTFLLINSRINSAKCIEVLEEKLSLFIDICEANAFQHDKVPYHMACAVASWFQKHQIQALEWLGNSPILNLIENVADHQVKAAEYEVRQYQRFEGAHQDNLVH